MYKKYCFVVLLQFLSVVSLFSSSPRKENFSIYNYTNKIIIIECEYIVAYKNRLWRQRINNIPVTVDAWATGYMRIKPNHAFPVVGYFPTPENHSEFFDTYYFRIKIAEMPFCEKMRAIFKSFSIRTIDGEFIINDLDDLCNAKIEYVGDDYVLKIFEPNGHSKE
jgi:hypothetical protein